VDWAGQVRRQRDVLAEETDRFAEESARVYFPDAHRQIDWSRGQERPRATPDSRYLAKRTTVEAAHFLNVSRPFVIKEMESGRLPYRKVGTHRRVALHSLMDYQRRMRQQQEQALERMADNARELGLDY
jgi:excisionase family DNA binding protein